MKDYKLSTFLMDLILGSLTAGVWWVYRLIKVAITIGKN